MTEEEQGNVSTFVVPVDVGATYGPHDIFRRYNPNKRIFAHIITLPD